MSRRSVRQGVATFFGGTTFDPVSRTYTGGPLTSSGLGAARAYYPANIPDTDYFIGLPPGRGMGALMGVHLPDVGPEWREALGGATAGIKGVPYQVELHFYHLSTMGHTEDAQADLDALLDAAKGLIYGDRTLGGICTEAGERPSTRIRTRMAVPVVAARGEPQRTSSYAVITFGADVYITA
jgi:hypothetical protein